MTGEQPEKVAEFLHVAREAAWTNIERLIADGVSLFERERFPTAAFCGMTAIEEIGKLWWLIMASIPEAKVGAVIAELRNHPEKARMMAFSSLYVNSSADRRHGRDPVSGSVRTSGIILLARSGDWMRWRNACLYVDPRLKQRSVGTPDQLPQKEAAYYFISMAYEGLADAAWAPTGDPLGDFQWRDTDASAAASDRLLKELKGFMERHGGSLNLSSLDFLSCPDKYRQLAEVREKAKR